MTASLARNLLPTVFQSLLASGEGSTCASLLRRHALTGWRIFAMHRVPRATERLSRSMCGYGHARTQDPQMPRFVLFVCAVRIALSE